MRLPSGKFAGSFPSMRDKEIADYVKGNKSVVQAAGFFEVSEATVRRALRHFGVHTCYQKTVAGKRFSTVYERCRGCKSRTKKHYCSGFCKGCWSRHITKTDPVATLKVRKIAKRHRLRHGSRPCGMPTYKKKAYSNRSARLRKAEGYNPDIGHNAWVTSPILNGAWKVVRRYVEDGECVCDLEYGGRKIEAMPMRSLSPFVVD